eukprot:2582699-Lingulodinium_polyedra.AAC.1
MWSVVRRGPRRAAFRSTLRPAASPPARCHCAVGGIVCSANLNSSICAAHGEAIFPDPAFVGPKA